MISLYKSKIYKSNLNFNVINSNIIITKLNSIFFLFKDINFKTIKFNLLSFLNYYLLIFIGIIKLKIFNFPIHKKKFTVNRSPFVNKKSKDQFEIRYYKIKLIFLFKNSIFLYYIKNLMSFNLNFKSSINFIELKILI